MAQVFLSLWDIFLQFRHSTGENHTKIWQLSLLFLFVCFEDVPQSNLNIPSDRKAKKVSLMSVQLSLDSTSHGQVSRDKRFAGPH